MKSFCFRFQVLLVLLILISCDKPTKKIGTKKENKKELVEPIDVGFEVNDIEKIVLYSFYDKELLKDANYRRDINFNKDLQISNEFVKESVEILDKEQIESIFKTITKDSCNSQDVYECYNPRHAIVIKGKENKLLEAIDICFSCDNYELYVNNKKELFFCLDDIKNVFISNKIKYAMRNELQVYESEFDSVIKVLNRIPK